MPVLFLPKAECNVSSCNAPGCNKHATSIPGSHIHVVTATLSQLRYGSGLLEAGDMSRVEQLELELLQYPRGTDAFVGLATTGS